MGTLSSVTPSAFAVAGPWKARFVGQLYSFPAGESFYDLRLNQAVKLQGGYYWIKGATLSDTVSLSVVDVDGVVSPPGTVLSEYVQNLPVAPWDHQQELASPTAADIPAGLYLRVTYDNHGTGFVALGITYRWYVED
jgi:hypothetical protein